MKKLLKALSLLALSFILVACQNNRNQPAESASSQPVESQPAESQEVVSTESQADDPADNARDESAESVASQDTDKESDPDADPETDDSDSDTGSEVTGETVTLAFYVDGSEVPEAEYTVEFVEGMNVLEAMEAADGLDFTFSDEEGVITEVDGISNDWSTEQTWTYLLNGEYAELGVVSQTLEAGDEIAWYFGTADQIPVNLVPAE